MRIMLGVLVFFCIFLYGVFVGVREVFPFSQMKLVKDYFFPKENINQFRENYGLIDPNKIDGLPNILIIGDSISMGYTRFVRKNLEGKANVFRIPENGRDTIYGKRMLEQWIGDKKWDIIHFNFGLWDTLYRLPTPFDPEGKIFSTPNEYRENLIQIIAKLKKTKAKLIWCNTTPIPDGMKFWRKGDSAKYNKIAKKIMDDESIYIIDLYTHAIKKIDNIQNIRDVHFTQEGREYLAEKVSKEIENILKLNF